MLLVNKMLNHRCLAALTRTENNVYLPRMKTFYDFWLYITVYVAHDA